MCAPWRAGELWPFSDHVLTETQFHQQDGEDGVCPAHPREGLWGAATRPDQRAEIVTSAQIHEAAQMVKRSVPVHLWSPSLMFFLSHRTNTWRTPREQENQEVMASCWQNSEKMRRTTYYFREKLLPSSRLICTLGPLGSVHSCSTLVAPVLKARESRQSCGTSRPVPLVPGLSLTRHPYGDGQPGSAHPTPLTACRTGQHCFGDS